MGIFFWVLDLFMCRKQKSISAVKTKSSHSYCKRFYCTAEGFKAQQTALMHNRQLYCTTEGFTTESFNAQQTTSMHSRNLYCTAGSFIAQQEALSHSRKFCYIAKKSVMQQKLEKSSFCGRNWRKVTSAAETEDKHHILPAVSVLLGNETQFAHKPDQIELQLDRSQLPYLEYSSPIPQEAVQPTLTTKRPTTNTNSYMVQYRFQLCFEFLCHLLLQLNCSFECF